MWSVWLAFCDCGFHCAGPLMDKDKKLMEALWWEKLTKWKTGSCSNGQGHTQKSSIQFSVDGWGSVPSLLFDLRPNYGGGNEDNGDLLQKVPCMHCCAGCPWGCSRPPPTHTSAGDYWTLPGKSGSVSCGVIAPFSWVLVHTRFSLCPPRVCFPVLCKFWWLYGGLMATSSKRAYATPRVSATVASHCWPIPPQETLKHISGSVSVGSLGPVAHKVCLSPPSVSGGYGVWF